MSKAARTAFLLLVAATTAFTGGGSGDDVLAADKPASSGAAEKAAVPAPPTAVPAIRARGGVGILAALSSASAVVVGVVSQPRKIDLHGWSAELKVDEVLAGKLALGDTLTIAWEELATSRPLRFVADDRLLVVLAPLPTQSLWRKRFADVADQRKVLVVAGGGEAFLVAPDGATLNALQHYLAMAAPARDGASGYERLAELVATGNPAIAAEALERLEGVTTPLGPDAVGTLLEAASNSRSDNALRSGALVLAARQDPSAVRATVVKLSEPGSPIRAEAYRVLAGLPGGLTSDQVTALLAAPEPELRVVGVGALVDPGARERLLKISRDDKAASVRLAAGQALVVRYGADVIPDVIALLDDPEAPVRNGIASAIGRLGSVAVGPLRSVVDNGSERAALAAALGLSRAGPEGGVALAAIASLHPNEAVRTFAKLAVGKALGEAHEHEGVVKPAE